MDRQNGEFADSKVSQIVQIVPERLSRFENFWASPELPRAATCHHTSTSARFRKPAGTTVDQKRHATQGWTKPFEP